MPTQTQCGFNDSGLAKGNELLTLLGPTLVVDVGYDSSYGEGSTSAPEPGIKQLGALVDTGAGESCIDNLLAATLNLPVIDRKAIAGSSGAHVTNVYLAQIHIPSLNYTIYGQFAGVDLIAGGQFHQVLIGRTFLANFRMIYEGDTGTVTLTKLS
jgi:predicted aspartyl protease